ncbi:MAG: PIN domain-containing protein [Paracoccaceae bacterium]|nr:PIN domain-containing protein [Paracoccaceae bacterium]MDE3123868.1 PIN domain-containing protein [Paracoccaceae bacterium]
MKAVLDACVLYPSVLREVLLGAARAGLFTPLWSSRILEEWARAAARLGPAQEAIARGEIALTRADFPRAEVPPDPALEARLWLPDHNDIHVLAAAIRGGADSIITYNASDFPRGILAQEGLSRSDPDAFLLALDRSAVMTVTQAVKARAENLSGQDWPLRRLLKKAGLPRLGKALDP